MLGKSIKNFVNSGIFLGFMVLLASCKKNTTEEFSPRVGVDVDVIEFPYAGSEQVFTVRSDKPWEISVSDNSWLTLSLSEGTLTDGSPEKVSVVATRNSGSRREATLAVAIEGQHDIEILVLQEDGFVLLEDAVIEGVLKVDEAMDETNQISIPYSRGTVNEKLLVSVTASGEGAAGIMPVEDMELTIGSEQGTLSIPLSGKPLNEGVVVFDISVSDNYTNSLSTQVLAKDELPLGEVYYDQKFDLMQWGGDYINKKSGVKGEFIGKEENDVDGKPATIYYEDKEAPIIEVDYLEVGSPNFFHLSRDYRASRGAPSPRGLGGSGMFERPGYLQVGDGEKEHSLMTQQIWTIPSGQTKKVRVSVDLAIWEGSSKNVFLRRQAGTGTFSVDQLLVENEFEWKTYEFFIEGANSSTRIRFGTDTEVGPDGLYGRFFIRNILVQEVLE